LLKVPEYVEARQLSGESHERYGRKLGRGIPESSKARA
jgi:hypothetical protein